jgi:Bacterial regulatory helix-turn-helix protein, lysR family
MYASVELRLFRYVIAVAEGLHFSRAALRERIAQPSLSKQILDLEERLADGKIAIVMIFLYSIDQTRWLARVTLSGSVDGHQIAAAMEALYQDPAWAAEFDILWDALRCLLELRLVCSVKSQRTLPCFQPMTVCGKLFFNVLAHNISGSRFVGLFVGTGTIGA